MHKIVHIIHEILWYLNKAEKPSLAVALIALAKFLPGDLELDL